MAISGLIGARPKLTALLCLWFLAAVVPRINADDSSTLHTVPQAIVDPRPIRLPVIDGTDIEFTRLLSANGLPQTKVSFVVQDDQGFMWFGTVYGLNRFDGYSFKEFVHDPGDPDSLSGVSIHALFKDRDGTLWVGCDQFLNRFNRATETFTQYPVPLVSHISQDTAGTLWLAAQTGLYALQPATGRIRHYSHDPNDPSSLSSNYVRSSGEDKGGRFWVASNGGLDEFDRRTGKVSLHIPVHGPPHAFSFYEDRFGVFWIFHVSGTALGVFDRKTNMLTHYSFDDQERRGTALTGVTAMLEDRDGTLWLGTHGAGLLKFDRDHRRFIRYRNNPADPDSLPQDSVESVFADREGSIWAGLGRMGLTHFATKPLPFKKFLNKPGTPSRTREPFVGAIYEDRQGILWIGTAGALNRIDREAGQHTSYRRVAGPAAQTDAITIREDGSGNLWVGTYGHGLLRFDRRTGLFKTYRHHPADSSSLSSDTVSRLLVDHNGTLWAATGDGLNRFDAVTGRFTSYRPDPKGESPFYLELVEDREGALWLGADSSGLYRFDPVTGQFTLHYHHETNRPGTLSDNRVNSVYFDSSDTMWVGTQNGLDKFDRKNGTFSAYTRRDGLPGNAVSCVLEDTQGDLWMSTNNGVATFNSQSGTSRSYSTADGLPGADLTGWGACFKSPSGEMFFGGFGGATAFFPENVAGLSDPPPIVLTDFRLSGNPVAIGSHSPLHTSISSARDIVLAHDQYVFSLTIAALSYSNPATNRYRYKLDGLQHDWNDVSSDQRQATYTTLPAGSYTFRAQGATSHGPWSEPGVALRIEILPPWWGTSWFQTIAACALVLAGWGAHRVRLWQIARGLRAQFETRAADRERIAEELHDTLIQDLAALSLQAEIIDDQLPQEPDAAKHTLETMRARMQHVVSDGRRGMTELHVGVTGGDDLADALSRAAQDLRGENGPSFHVVVQGHPRALHPLVGDEVYRIAREAMANAFRHAAARQIDVEVSFASDELRVRVQDDGRGVSDNVIEAGRPGHFGLHGMRNRARNIGGTLNVWSRVDVGTEVAVIVPGRSAFLRPSE